MKKQAVADLTNVIRANTERRSIEELAARGKRHFRVVSGDKVMKLIQAVVDDAIRREAGELAMQDRDRLVSETRQEFNRVLKIQTEQDAAIRRQRELADYFREQAEKAEGRISALKAEVGEGRRRLELRESELSACFDQERCELTRDYEEKLAEVRERLERSEVRLGNARETIEGYDREFARVTRELEVERDRLSAATAAGPESSRARDQAWRVTLRTFEQENRTLTRRLGATQRALAQARRELADRPGSPEVAREVRELRDLVSEVAARPPGIDTDTLAALMDRITERDANAAAQMESRFRERMEETLREVTRALSLATARPIDTTVEATDVLIERLFDHEDELGTNLDDLAVEELSGGQNIADSLARLRAARGRSTENGNSET
jgi:hypothetical protein